MGVIEAKQEHRQTRVDEERRKSRNSTLVYLGCLEVYKTALAGAYSLISLAAAVAAAVLGPSW